MNGNYNGGYNDYSNYNRRNNNRGPNVWLIVSIALVLLIVGGLLGAVMINANNQTAPVDADAGTPLPEETPQQPTPTASAVQPSAAIPDHTPSMTLPEFSNYTADLVAAVEDSVVGISNYGMLSYGSEVQEYDLGSGSGVIISEDGYVLTNHHVIEGATKVTVLLHDGEEVEAEVLGSDAVLDIALLKVNKTGLNAANLGDSSTVRTGEFVLAIGSPLGHELAGSVTFGTVSAASRELSVEDGYTVDMIQTDAAINPGNSGGALLNMNGEVIGINTRKNSGITSSGAVIEGLGFAIPINDVKPLIDEIRETGTVTRPGIGITGNYGYHRQYGMSGILVVGFAEDSPAQAAGLKVDDFIVYVDDQPVNSINALRYILYSKEVGQTVKVEVVREGKKLEFEVALTVVAPQS